MKEVKGYPKNPIIPLVVLVLFLSLFVYSIVMDSIEEMKHATVSLNFIVVIAEIFIVSLIFIYPTIWAIVFLIKRREIMIDQNMIVIKIFNPKEIRYEDIRKISVSFFVIMNRINKWSVKVHHIIIKPKGKILSFYINGDHFTDTQRMDIYCTLNNIDKLLPTVWKYQIYGREPKKRTCRFLKSEEAKEAKDYIDDLCK